MNFTVKFRGSIPQQKPKFRGTARNSTVCGKLWALVIIRCSCMCEWSLNENYVIRFICKLTEITGIMSVSEVQFTSHYHQRTFHYLIPKSSYIFMISFTLA